MRLSPSLRKTLKSIQGDISGIRASLAALIAPRPDVQELARSIRNANEADNLQRKGERGEFIKLLATKKKTREAAERYNRRYQYKNYCVQKWLAIGTWLAFTAAAIYAGIAHQTLKEIERQTKAVECASVAATESVYIAAAALQQNRKEFIKTSEEMSAQTTAQQGAADAANASVANAQTVFRSQQRAWVGITSGGEPHFGEHNDVSMPFVVKNTGRTPARNVEISVKVEVLPRSSFPWLGLYDVHSIGTYHFKTGAMFADDVVEFGPYYVNPDWGLGPDPNHPEHGYLAKYQVDGITSGDWYIVGHGKITYEDAFKVTHWITFCKFTQSSQPSTEAQKRCSEYNDTDNN